MLCGWENQDDSRVMPKKKWKNWKDHKEQSQWLVELSAEHGLIRPKPLHQFKLNVRSTEYSVEINSLSLLFYCRLFLYAGYLTGSRIV